MDIDDADKLQLDQIKKHDYPSKTVKIASISLQQTDKISKHRGASAGMVMYPDVTQNTTKDVIMPLASNTGGHRSTTNASRIDKSYRPGPATGHRQSFNDVFQTKIKNFDKATNKDFFD